MKRTVYQIGGGWGNAIHFMPDSTTKVYGFKARRPQKGDELHVPMQSGRIGVYRFKEVDLMSDPDDMFFADVKLHHYHEDTP